MNEDEISEIFIPQNSDSLARLRCFIGDTYSSDLYKIDGYGNLQNIDKSDLECLCDELIGMLRTNLKELKQAEL